MKKIDKIPKIPKIPTKFLEKLNKDEAILFLGNGVARFYGVPSWKELALSYLADWWESEDISYDTYEKLKEKEDALELLTICSGHESFKREKLKDKLEPKNLENKEKILKIYGYLRDFKAGYITTNYDDYIEKAKYTDDKLGKEEEDLLKKLEEPVKEDLIRVQLSGSDNMDNPKNKIVYLHGKATRKENEKDCENKIILTLKDYVEHYKDSRNNGPSGPGKKFLKLIFNKIVLFIGFGLKEFEIIQHICPPTSDMMHYLLLGVFESERYILEEYKEYYKILNIEPIFYNISEKGYCQLKDVLQAWSKQIRRSRVKSYKDRIKSKKDFDNLKKVVESKNGSFRIEGLDEKEKRLLKILKNDKMTLYNFFVESCNPSFIPHLNFFEGVPVDGRKNYKVLVNYLFRISERIKKELADLAQENIKKEYSIYLLKALKNTFNGYQNNDMSDDNVPKTIALAINNLELDYFDNEIIKLFDSYLNNEKSKNIDQTLTVYELLPILKRLVESENLKVEKLALVIINALNKNNNNNNIFYYVKDFFVENSIIKTFAKFCSDDFILQIANKLSTVIETPDINIEICDMNMKRLHLYKQKDCSIGVIFDTNIKFNLPYVNFSEKQDIIQPIIERELCSQNIAKKIKKQDFQEIIKRILFCYTYIWKDFSYVFYPSLFDNPNYENFKNILIYIFKELLREKLKNLTIEDFKNLYDKVTSKNKYFIFKRILLYCYGKEFQKARIALFDLIDKEKELLLCDDAFEAEIYKIKEENVCQFDSNELKKIESLIEDGPYYEDSIKNVDEKYKKFWRQRQYAPLVTHFKEKYDALCMETGVKKEFFNFRDWVIKNGSYKSKFNQEELMQKLCDDTDSFIAEINDFDKKFKEDFKSNIGEKSYAEGLGKQFEDLATKYPKFITERMDIFLKLNNSLYIKDIFYGLKHTANKPDILWTNLVEFIQKYKCKDKRETASVISAFANIIPNDFNVVSFDNIIYKLVCELLNMYSDIKPSFKSQKYLEELLLTPVRTILDKFLCLFFRKYKNKNNDEKEDIKLKELYERLFSEDVIEAYIFFGMYFADFFQFNKEWTIEKSEKILLLISSKQYLWEAFFDGFLNSSTYITEYYECMQKHFKKGIDLWKTNRAKLSFNGEQFPRFLSSFFLYGIDNLSDENSLLNYCYKNEEFNLLYHSIIEISKGINSHKLIIQKLKLWEYLYEKIHLDSKLSNEQKMLLGAGMFELIPALKKLDYNTYTQIEKLIDTLNDNYFNSIKKFLFLENLLNLAKHIESVESVGFLGKLFLKYISKNVIFNEEGAKQILDLLIKYNESKEIREIMEEIKCKCTEKGYNNIIC